MKKKERSMLYKVYRAYLGWIICAFIGHDYDQDMLDIGHKFCDRCLLIKKSL